MLILLLPEVFKPLASKLGVPCRVLDVAMSEPFLQRPGVMAVVGKLVAAGMPEHVRVDGEGEPGRLTEQRQQLAEGRRRHGPAPLAGEHVDALGYLLALEAAQVADFGASDEMHAGPAVLAAGDMEATLREIEHVPSQGTQFTCPEPMAVGQEDHGRVAVGVARADALPCGRHEELDLLGGEVLPGTSIGVGKAPRRNLPIYSGRPAPFPHP
jgi:hypothetical protein